MSFQPHSSPPLAPPPAPTVATTSRPEQGSDVVTFLDRAGLGVYSPVFFSYGFTTIESLQSIRPEDYQRMQVKAGHQKKLKLALENLRSAGQVDAVGMATPVAGLATSGSNLAEANTSATMAGLGPHGYNQQQPLQQPYQKNTMWVETNNEAGYQWVDGPGPQSPAAPAGALSYPVEQTTVEIGRAHV